MSRQESTLDKVENVNGRLCYLSLLVEVSSSLVRLQTMATEYDLDPPGHINHMSKLLSSHIDGLKLSERQ